jgi:hypothetical protein
MSIMHFRSSERRRTTRSSMTMNVLAYGETDNREKFNFWTKTTSVAAHGGVIQMEQRLQVGQVFQLMNEYNMKKAVARMVAVRQAHDGVILGAFEFVERGENFWSMAFPPPGAKPIRRFVSKPGAGGTN